MKIVNTILFVALGVFVQRSHAQGFINLNFENAVIIPDPSSPYYPSAVYASKALPGWTVVGLVSPTDIIYNTISLGTTSVSILGTNGSPAALNGAYSIDLYGGGTLSTGASISQTGLVPADAASIRFIAQGSGALGGTLLLSLGGQNIPFFALVSGADYTSYGANLPSDMLGQSEDLMFTAAEGGNNYWEIDNIQFSPALVPEPNALGLSALGGLFFAWRRWKARAA